MRESEESEGGGWDLFKPILYFFLQKKRKKFSVRRNKAILENTNPVSPSILKTHPLTPSVIMTFELPEHHKSQCQWPDQC